MPTMTIENWLNCDEASAIIGCSPDHVRLLARKGELKGRKLNQRFWLIDRKDAERLRDQPADTGRPRSRSRVRRSS